MAKASDFILSLLIGIIFTWFSVWIYTNKVENYWSVSKNECVKCINCSCKDIEAPGPLTIYVE